MFGLIEYLHLGDYLGPLRWNFILKSSKNFRPKNDRFFYLFVGVLKKK